jgi:hypothetical protein
MRFTLALLSALAAGASAAVLAERQTGGTLNCACLPDKSGAKGTNIQILAKTYTCAYPAGSCEWNQVRPAPAPPPCTQSLTVSHRSPACS